MSPTRARGGARQRAGTLFFATVCGTVSSQTNSGSENSLRRPEIPETGGVGSVGSNGLVTSKRVDHLEDLTVLGIWEAHLEGELVPYNAVDRAAVRAAGVLAEKGYWTWTFQAATEDLTSWGIYIGITS